MADFKFKYCSYAVRVAPSVARRRDKSLAPLQIATAAGNKLSIKNFYDD